MAAAYSDASLDTMVRNFETMLTALTYMEAGYNPGPAILKLATLQTQAAGARASLNDVSNGESAFDVVIALRAVDFALLPDRVTRTWNTLKAYSPKSPVMKSVEGLVRQLRGKRATDAPLNPDGTPADTNSAARGTFPNKVKLLSDLINDLKKDPLYTPSDATVTTAGLTAFRDVLSAHNAAVANAQMPLDNARAARDAKLFDPETGLRAVAQQVKAYVKATFGAKSPQYKQISGLKI